MSSWDHIVDKSPSSLHQCEASCFTTPSSASPAIAVTSVLGCHRSSPTWHRQCVAPLSKHAMIVANVDKIEVLLQGGQENMNKKI